MSYSYPQPATANNGGYYAAPPQSQSNPSSYPPYHAYYQQQHHQPAPGHGLSPDEQGFRDHLATLTWNSRDIITRLSMIAGALANTPSARFVADSIEQQLRMAGPEFKLPVFYLLDSILKNHGEPYNSLLGPSIHLLFIDVYNAVDTNVKNKMREMLVTWRTGGVNGAALFKSSVLDSIERGVYGPGSNNSGPRNPPIAQVWTELEVVLNAKERAFTQNPYDEVTKKHLAALRQLREYVPNMSPDELGAVLIRLREIARTSSNSQPAPPPPVVPVPSNFTYNAAPFLPAPISYGAGQAQQPNLTALAQLLGTINPSIATAAPPANALPNLNASNLSALLATIQGQLPGLGAAAFIAPAIDVDPSKMTLDEYEKTVLRMKVKLTSSDLMRTRPAILPFLYLKDAPQCGDCGLRFPVGEQGKQMLRDHLDKHFRQNVKASEGGGRGVSRSWFIGKKNWVDDVPEMASNKHNPKRTSRKQSEKAKAEAAVQLRKDLEAKFVIVPPGSEGKPATCRICMEDIPIEFQEDEEQWIWRNAIMHGNKVYHATCHHDISKRREEGPSTPDTNTIGLPGSAQRTKLLASSRMQSNSPRPSVSRETPPRPSPLAGNKRKQEGDGVSVKEEPIDPRPLKRVALEAPAA